MTRRTIVVDSEIWKVYPTGRITVYGKDEFGLLFELGTGPERKRRFTRYSPLGSKSTDASLAELTERQLLDFFHQSQPAWTSPEGGYGVRLVEEVEQLPVSELGESCVGTLGSQRREIGEAPLALGAGPEFEQQPKFILPINRDAARGINLPDAAVYHDGGSCQGQGLVISPAQAACEGAPPSEP